MEKEYNPALQFDAFTAGIEDGGLRSSSSIAILACYIIARSEEKLTKKNVVDALVEGKIANYFDIYLSQVNAHSMLKCLRTIYLSL